METIGKIQLEIQSLRKQLDEQKEKIRQHELKIASRSANINSKSLVKKKPVKTIPSVNLRNVARINLVRYRYCNRIITDKMTFIPILNDTRLAFVSLNIHLLDNNNVNINDLPASIRYKDQDYIKTPNGDYNLACTEKSELYKLKYEAQCYGYTSTGVCMRYACKFKHNEDRVRLCSRVKGAKTICYDNNCSLSHQPNEFNSPACLFFQNYNCLKQNCIFTHKYEEKGSLVCRPFSVLGYCGLGIKCRFKHNFTCPDLDEYGQCIVQDCNCDHNFKNLTDSRVSTMRQNSNDKIQIIDDNINENYENSKNNILPAYGLEDANDVESIVKDNKELSDLDKDFLSFNRYE